MSSRLKSLDIGVRNDTTLMFLVLHIPLAFWASSSVTFSTFYAFTIFFLGALAALSGRGVLTACFISYIVGAEVLFRMTGAKVFWEYGKYAISLIALVYLVFGRRRAKSAKAVRTPLLFLYFLLLLPAVWLTEFPNITEWRYQISFNMSGHLALCLCGLFFSRLAVNRDELRRIFVCLVAPVVSISYIALATLLATEVRIWGMSSTKMTSGAFGPNQVSSTLGLAAFLCIVLYLLSRKQIIFKNVFLALSVLFITQAILTFSRGGVLGAAISGLIFLVVISRSRKNRIIGFCLGVFFITITYFFIIPKLDRYTEGFLTKRYMMREKVGGVKVFETGHRVDFMKSDLVVFNKHVFTGVGVGKARKVRRDEWGKPITAHTEWTRILAEHGVLGLLSLIFLWVWILSRFRSAGDPTSKAIILSFVLYAVIYMSHASMRLAIPAFIIGFIGANFESEEA